MTAKTRIASEYDPKDQDEKQSFIGIATKVQIMKTEPNYYGGDLDSSRSSSMDMEGGGCCSKMNTNGALRLGRKNKCTEFRRSWAPWLLFLMAGFLAITVLSIELWRSQELSTLRDEVSLLRMDVEMLKHRLVEDDLIDELKAFEDAVYAEESSNDNRRSFNRKAIDLDDTDNDDDDEDDDETEESGDDEYDISYDHGELPNENGTGDRNHRRTAETNRKVYHKTSHDMMEEELLADQQHMSFHDEDYQEGPEEMLNLKETKILGEVDSSRPKRELPSTQHGVPIVEDSYALRRNKTHDTAAHKLYESLLQHARQEPRMTGAGWEPHAVNPAVLGKQHRKKYIPNNLDHATLEHQTPPGGIRVTSQAPSPMYIRRSRVMQTDEDKSKAYRKVVRKSQVPKNYRSDEDKYLEQVAPSISSVSAPGTRHRRPDRRNLEAMGVPRGAGRGRMMAAAHFSGDTSKYIAGHHEHYNGNGRLRHPDGVFSDWQPAPWVAQLGMDRHFRLEDGAVTIKDTGIYFVYAQIYYLDEHDTNGYRVYQNNEPLLQCTTMTHSVDRVAKSNTCYTGMAVHLVAGDKLSLRDLGGMRYSLFEPTKSFFGVIKLSDARIK